MRVDSFRSFATLYKFITFNFVQNKLSIKTFQGLLKGIFKRSATYQDVFADVLQPVFVSETFELRPEGDKLSILLLKSTLLIHDSCDLLRHHLCHLFTHIGLQVVEKEELLY